MIYESKSVRNSSKKIDEYKTEKMVNSEILYKDIKLSQIDKPEGLSC